MSEKESIKNNENSGKKKNCPVCGKELIEKPKALNGEYSLWYCPNTSDYTGIENVLGACPLAVKCFSAEDYKRLVWKKYVPQNEEDALKLAFAS